MAFSLTQQLQSLGVATQLGAEIQAQLGGTGNRNRLMEAGLPEGAAQTLATGITAKTVSAVTLTRQSVPPAVAKIVAAAVAAS
jgi:hypothetical protein